MGLYSYGDGRVWLQLKKFEPYLLFLLGGLTDVTDPVGTLSVVMEPDPGKRRKSKVSDIMRGEPGLPGFSIETDLKKSLNYMLGIRCAVNWQAHMGACDRADNYFTSEIGLGWNTAYRGDLGIDRVSKIRGDDSPDAVSVPWSAENGPLLIDFLAEFLSARTITETEAITDMFFLEAECFEDCASQEDAGENGYATTTTLAGSPANIANLWYSEDDGDTWADCSERPFAGGEDISCVTAMGTKNNHRVIVSRGTTDGTAPAEIAYADVTAFGTTPWNNVDVGSVDGQFIAYMYWLRYDILLVVTNDGYIYKSKDGGITWTDELSTAVNPFNDVVACGDGTAWAVGDTGTIYFSEDYGDTWTAVTAPEGWAATDIPSVSLSPDGTIIIGNSAGAVRGSYDDGMSWVALAAQGVTPTNVVRIRAYDNDHIWMVVDLDDGSSRVVRSTDGGASFRLWSLNLPPNSGVNALVIVDPNIVVVGGDPHGGTAFISRTKSTVTGV